MTPEPRDSQRGAPTLTVTLASLSFVPFGLFIYHISAPSSLAPCCSPAYAHTHTHTLWATWYIFRIKLLKAVFLLSYYAVSLYLSELWSLSVWIRKTKCCPVKGCYKTDFYNILKNGQWYCDCTSIDSFCNDLQMIFTNDLQLIQTTDMLSICRWMLLRMIEIVYFLMWVRYLSCNPDFLRLPPLCPSIASQLPSLWGSVLNLVSSPLTSSAPSPWSGLHVGGWSLLALLLCLWPYPLPTLLHTGTSWFLQQRWEAIILQKTLHYVKNNLSSFRGESGRPSTS